jgi:hypothetical protein
MPWTVIIDVWGIVDEKQTTKRIKTKERFDSIAEAEEKKKEIEKQGYGEYQPSDIIKVFIDEIGQEITLLKDSEWCTLDGETCRVLKFTPLCAVVEDGRVKASKQNMPYASVVIECPSFQGKAKGFITNKVDFAMLWAAFKERAQVKGARLEFQYDSDGIPAFAAKHGVATDEEVWLVWTKNNYIGGLSLMNKFLPSLIVSVCPKGAYELMTNRKVKPELTGEARYLAERPLVTWTPKVMRK